MLINSLITHKTYKMRTFLVYILFAFLLVAKKCIAQDSLNNYAYLRAKAFNCYSQKNYTEAVTLDLKAFDIAYTTYHGYEDTKFEAAYDAACSWALSGHVASAIQELFIIAKDGRLDDYNLITTDDDLKSLARPDAACRGSARLRPLLFSIRWIPR